jgi:ABC-type transporter Mla subunit MlaD
MKNKIINSSFLIGLFVILAIFILIGSVFFLSSNEIFKSTKTYVTYFDGSVQGLEIGSPVKYLGVPVGSVTGISILPKMSYVQVKFTLEPTLTINQEMRVKQEFMGISGMKFLQLFTPEKGQKLSKIKLNFKPEHKVIPSAPSGIDEIAIAAEDVMNNLLQVEFGEISYETILVLKNMNRVLNDKNIESTIINFEKSTNSLANFLSILDTTMVLNNLIRSSYDVANSADEMVATIQALKEKVQRVEVGEFLDKVYMDYDTTLQNFDYLVRNISVKSDFTIMSLNSLIEEFRKSNNELKKTLKTLSDDPSNVFFVKPPEKD